MLGSRGRIPISKRTISGLLLHRPTEAGNSRLRMVEPSTRAPTVKIVIRPRVATVAVEATGGKRIPLFFQFSQNSMAIPALDPA
jgi:hypothetical protein